MLHMNESLSLTVCFCRCIHSRQFRFLLALLQQCNMINSRRQIRQPTFCLAIIKMLYDERNPGNRRDTIFVKSVAHSYIGGNIAK